MTHVTDVVPSIKVVARPGKEKRVSRLCVSEWDATCQVLCPKPRGIGKELLESSRRNLRHHHPRHFRIEPANAVGANDKIGRIENVALDEIQHRAINLRPFRLH